MKILAGLLLGFSAALAVTTAVAQPVTLYDNFGTDLRRYLDETNSECGDEITLAAGTPRVLNSLSFEYWLKPTVPVADTSVRVRFYYNDGTPLPGTSEDNPPRTMFYDSGDILLTKSGQASLTLDNLSVTVPDKFTWSVQFSGGSTSQGQVAGVELFSPPTVGGNSTEFWEKNGDTWDQFYWDDFHTDFGARLIAVPEPASLTLLLLAGGATLTVWRRRTSRRQ
jgi:hypothetical protein